MWMSRVVPVLVVLSTVLVGVDGHAGQVKRLAGRVSLKINSAVPPGGGFGFTWSQGYADLGRRHHSWVFGDWLRDSGQ